MARLFRDFRCCWVRHDGQVTSSYEDQQLCSAVHVSGLRCELDERHEDVHWARTEHPAEPLVWTVTPAL